MNLAIFDLDHTLLTINSSFHYYLCLFRMGVFAPSSLFFALFWALHYRFCRLPPQDLHQKIFQKFLKNLPFSSLSQPAIFFSLELERFLYEPLVHLLKETKKRGHYTLLLSASPTFLLAPLAKSLGFDEWKGSEYELDNEDRLANIASLMSGEEKREYALTLSKRLCVNKENIAVYTDSHWDLPLLEISGNPVAVHPDGQLKAICKKRGWKVMSTTPSCIGN
jgi:phosphoserine phosphatase